MNRRILVIDDNHAIHEDFCKILAPRGRDGAYADLTAEVLGDTGMEHRSPGFEVDSAFQGQEGLERVKEAGLRGRPYALAFVDVRMPPGWDGIETIARLWQEDPELQIVICTAYSDHSWAEITARLGGSDKLLILRKPFDVIEVLQLAHALTRKWCLGQESKRHLKELDQKIEERTRELGQSEMRYRSLFEHMLEGFAYCQVIQEGERLVDFVFLEVNPAFKTLTGLKDVTGRRFSEVLPGILDSHPELLERCGMTAISGQPDRFEIHLEPLRAWLAMSVHSPAKEHFVVVFDNITQRKEAELRLAAFAKLDHQLGTAKTTKEAARILAGAADELIGWDACRCDLYSSAEESLSPVLSIELINGQRTESEGAALNFEPALSLAKQAIKKGSQLVLGNGQLEPPVEAEAGGEVAPTVGSILCVPVRNGPNIIGVLSAQKQAPQVYGEQDLEGLQALADRGGGALERIRTEESLRQTQEQLRHSQKLEAIGQLAGGVAHDFSNLLTVIRGNAELVMLDHDRLNESLTTHLKQVITAAERAATLTRQLLAFSRKQIMQFRPLKLNDVIVNLTKMLQRLIGENIQLQCSYGGTLPLVRADIGMFEQVLVNLVVNARDAMPQGGQVVLETEVVSLDRACESAHPEGRAGKFVCCSVRDTGTGIAPEDLPHIFEPFFTTKDVGKGTGLGLSTVYGIVKQHSGWVEVTSELGAGSTFKVFLPAEEPSTRPEVTPQAAMAQFRGGSEAILLVEDEEAVRLVTGLLLVRSGYSVTEAASGRQALELWRQHTGEFDLVVTDLVMPGGISGADLVRQLWAETPDLKVVFLSGYSASIAGKEPEFLKPGRSRFVQKPCPPLEFLNIIRDCLDGREPQQGK